MEGGLRARGIADDKSNLIVHLGVLRAYGGRPPTGLRIVLEGQEEYGSAFDDYPPTDPARFACDAMVIADVGNLRPGSPTLTTGLRGASEIVVEVRTLDEPRHSGEFGGAAPDALLALLKALATLHDVHGDVAVEGLRREEWSGTTYTEEEFRTLAGVRDGMPLIGSGSLGERLWSGPAVTVVGIDAPGVDRAASAVVPYARAKLNLRFHPEQDPRQVQGLLVTHLESLRPFGIPLTVTPGDTGPGFEPATGGPAYRAALTALREGWGAEPAFVAAWRLDPARQRPGQGSARRRDPALRRTGQPVQSARAQRAGPLLGTPLGRHRRGGVPAGVRGRAPRREHHVSTLDTGALPGEKPPTGRKFVFPSALTVLVVVTLAVWAVAFLIPSGAYDRTKGGAPIQGTYHRVDSGQSVVDRLNDLFLSPVNGLYGVQDARTGQVGPDLAA